MTPKCMNNEKCAASRKKKVDGTCQPKVTILATVNGVHMHRVYDCQLKDYIQVESIREGSERFRYSARVSNDNVDYLSDALNLKHDFLHLFPPTTKWNEKFVIKETDADLT